MVGERLMAGRAAVCRRPWIMYRTTADSVPSVACAGAGAVVGRASSSDGGALLARIAVWSVPALLIGLGAPLALRWIPPNGLYGYRTGKAFASSENWYYLNEYMGLFMILGGVASLLFAVATMLRYEIPVERKVVHVFGTGIVPVFIGILIASVLAARL